MSYSVPMKDTGYIELVAVDDSTIAASEYSNSAGVDVVDDTASEREICFRL